MSRITDKLCRLICYSAFEQTCEPGTRMGELIMQRYLEQPQQHLLEAVGFKLGL